MRFLPIIAASLAALTLSGASQAATYIADFEELAHNGANQFQASGLVQDGLTFTNSNNSANAFVVFGKNDSRNGDVGGATLATYYSSTVTRVERSDHSSFDLSTIELGDYFNSGQPLKVKFSFFDANSVSSFDLFFTLDNLSGLQTVALNQTNLKAFEYTFLEGWGQIDNVTFSDVTAPIPEPASWALLLLGFAGMGGLMRGGAARNRLQTLAA